MCVNIFSTYEPLLQKWQSFLPRLPPHFLGKNFDEKCKFSPCKMTKPVEQSLIAGLVNETKNPCYIVGLKLIQKLHWNLETKMYTFNFT